MKKALLSILLCGFSSIGFSQVIGGTLVNAGRKLLNEASFNISSKTSGEVILELSVNPKGEVTSSKVIREESTISSTPLIMQAQNSSKKLKFTAGTHYEEFDHVKVKYTYKES